MKATRFTSGDRVIFEQQLFNFGDQRDRFYGLQGTFLKYLPKDNTRCYVLFDGKQELVEVVALNHVNTNININTMGRPKGSKNKPKPDLAGNPMTSSTSTDEAPKRRGRPPGSKNKAKEETTEPSGAANPIDSDNPPRVKVYTQEELDAARPVPSVEKEVVTSTPSENQSEETPPVSTPAPVKLTKDQYAKYAPLLEFVEWLDTNMSDQWKFHYDVLGIKDGRNRKQTILYFVGCSFGYNTGLLEELGKKLKK